MDAETPTGGQTLLTVDQACDRLAIRRTTMYGLLKRGEIESLRIGTLRRIPADSVEAYVDQLRVGFRR